jgi:hypothetical protein
VVDDPTDRPWSSYLATVGLERSTKWLTTEAMLGTFGRNKGRARKAYKRIVDEGIGGENIWGGLNSQIFLGDERFIERMQKLLDEKLDNAQIPKIQRRKPPPSLDQIYGQSRDRDAAIVVAHATGEYSYTLIGKYFVLHFATVVRIVRKGKQGAGGKGTRG